MSVIKGEMMQDKIERLGNSIIQHGSFNDRIYLMKFSPDYHPQIIADIEKLAKEKTYSKLFLKIPQYALGDFLLHGYHIEAFIPGYFHDGNDAVFVSKFLDKERNSVEKDAMHLFNELLNKRSVMTGVKLKKNCLFRKLASSDASGMVTVFSEVFESYPFPIHDQSYLEKTMDENTTYFGIFENEELVAISSSEADQENNAVEMTDFAVKPKCRGRKYALLLLQEMEKEMKAKGVKTCFTIARLNSPAMNKTFLNAGYKYSGTLVKNTNISGKIESMNVLYKKIK